MQDAAVASKTPCGRLRRLDLTVTDDIPAGLLGVRYILDVTLAWTMAALTTPAVRRQLRVFDMGSMIGLGEIRSHFSVTARAHCVVQIIVRLCLREQTNRESRLCLALGRYQ